MRFDIRTTPYLQVIDSEDTTLNQFFTGEEVTRTFRVFFSESLAEGYIDLPVEIRYNSQVFEYDIRIFLEDDTREADLFIGKLTTIPQEIVRNSQSNQLSVTLQNLGDTDAELITAELLIDSPYFKPAYAYSLEDSLSRIEGGEEKTLEFTFDLEEEITSSPSGVLSLRYRTQVGDSSSYTLVEKTLPLTLPLTPAPYFEVIDVQQLDSFEAGSVENRLKITLRNIGEDDAEDVRVRIIPDISYPLLFEETTQYVTAKIPQNGTADILFKTEVTDSALPQEYTSTLLIESLVGDARYSQEDTVSITIPPGTPTSTLFIAIIIVITLLLIAGLVGFVTLKTKSGTKSS